MKIIVYGGTGYIGSHVVEQLREAGYNPLCVVRAHSNTQFLQSLGVDILTDDFDSLSDTSYINEGDIVINCIADTRRHITYDEQAKTDVQLTSHLFKAAQARHASRFIQLSTVMVYGFDRPKSAIDENYPLPEFGASNQCYTYNRTAIAREKALTSLALSNTNKNTNKSTTQLILVRPSNTIGARDTSFIPSITQPMRFGFFSVIGDGKWQFSCIDTRDIGRAFVHLMLLETAHVSTFLVKGFDLNWLELQKALETKIGKPCKTLTIPKALMMGSAKIMEAIMPYGVTLPVTQFDIEVISNHTLFDSRKIESTGFNPEYTLQDCLDAALKPVSFIAKD